MNPFDYIKSINDHKDIMVDELTEKEYNPFIVNRGLSYFSDCIFQANEMNRLPDIPKKFQYLFLLNTIRQRKRWAGKWHKQEKNDDVDAVMQYYSYSRSKALAVLDLLSVDDLNEIKKALDPGGLKGKK